VTKKLSLREIALLTTLPVVLGSLAQILVPYFVRSSKRVYRALKISFLIQIAGLALLFYSTHQQNITFYWTIITSLSLYWIGGLCGNPLWLDWVSGHIPPTIMNSYLSKRNAFIALMTLVAYLITAYLLHSQKLSNEIFYFIFLFAFLARSFGFLLQLKLMKEEAIFLNKMEKEVKANTRQLKYAVYVTVIGSFLFRSVVFIASPFFLPFMINEMKLGVMAYSLLTALPFIGRFLFLSGWGKASKGKHLFLGLQLAAIGVAIGPITWLGGGHNLGLITISQILTGLLWGGYELSQIIIIQKYWPGSTLNMLSFHLALSNLGSVFGSLVGAHYLNYFSSYEDLFIFSIELRLVAALLMLLGFLKIKETRFESHAYTNFLVTTLSLRPTTLWHATFPTITQG
jgi:MFS family permease